jgi:Bax protein
MRRSLFRYPVLFLGIFLLFALFSSCGDGNRSTSSPRIIAQVVRIDSLEQILPLTDSLVKPMLYTHVSGLNRLPGREARRKFIAAVLPSVLVAKHEIEERRKKLISIRSKKIWDQTDSMYFTDMKSRYKGKSMDDMLARIGTLPNSIVLAQAAMESGWGQSRIFLEGNNLFGMWSYNKFEPRIAAGKTRGQKRIYLRSYMDISQSITHYFDILSKSWAYKGLRKARLETTDPHKLLLHLSNFSERRSAYTLQLRKVIDQYDLTRYDQYQIDPAYIRID